MYPITLRFRVVNYEWMDISDECLNTHITGRRVNSMSNSNLHTGNSTPYHGQGGIGHDSDRRLVREIKGICETQQMTQANAREKSFNTRNCVYRRRANSSESQNAIRQVIRPEPIKIGNVLRIVRAE
jgi:hypothetical protein